jgi:hypothetical protein
MGEVLTLINNAGFPIAVAVWLLVKDSKEKQLMREALEKLTLAINNVIK